MRIIDSPVLAMTAKSLDDVEDLRIAAENRLRALTRDEADKDGEIRGLGLSPEHPDVKTATAILANIQELEVRQTKALESQMKSHPLFNWVKDSKGVGAKQGARLLAAVGDPYIAERVNKTPDGKIISVDVSPRTLREFHSYCGYGIADDGQARRRKKGERANWNAEAKMRVYLIANSIIKTKGDLRDVYDAARAKYDQQVHLTDCVRCGPSGKPALAGSTLSAGHAHARALRAVSKRVLSDLYYEAKRIHDEMDATEAVAA